MDVYGLILTVAVFLALDERSTTLGESLRAGGLHVCSRKYTFNTYYTASAQRIAYDNYRTCCKKVWGICLKRCTRYRTRMITYYVSKLKVNQGTSLFCCSGWARRGNQCPVAICRPACQSGFCVSPNKCHCKSGFTGKHCQVDINECLKSPCQQTCSNLRGSFACSCRRGYRKVSSDPKDGRCQNINECKTSKMLCSCAVARSDCKAKCVDTIGSYKCQCSTGYQLVHRKICKEIKTSRTAGQQDEQKVARKLYTLSTLPGSSDEDYMYAVNNKANNSLQ